MRTAHPAPASPTPNATSDSSTEGLFTASDLARKLKVSIADIRTYVSYGGRVHRDGRKVRLRVSDIEPWLDSLGKMRHLYSETMVWMETP